MKLFLKSIALLLVTSLATTGCATSSLLNQAIPTTAPLKHSEVQQQADSKFIATKASLDEFKQTPNLVKINKQIDPQELLGKDFTLQSTSDESQEGGEENFLDETSQIILLGAVAETEDATTFFVAIENQIYKVKANEQGSDLTLVDDVATYSTQWGWFVWPVVVAVVRVAVNAFNRQVAREAAKRALIESTKQLRNQVSHTAKINLNDKSRVNHIFKSDRGHIADASPANVKRIESAVNRQNYQGRDKFGNEVYLKRDGNEQIWVYARNGEIRDAGVNPPGRHRMLDPESRAVIDFSEDGFIFGWNWFF